MHTGITHLYGWKFIEQNSRAVFWSCDQQLKQWLYDILLVTTPTKAQELCHDGVMGYLRQENKDHSS